MPASNLETLFDFETQMETAVAAALSSLAGVTAIAQRNDDNKTAPFVTVQFVTGETLGQHYKHQNEYREKMFNGELTIGIATRRSASTDSHPSIRGKVRKAISSWQATANGINDQLDYLQVLDVASQGATVAISNDEDHDISTLRYQVAFQILDSAWPV